MYSTITRELRDAYSSIYLQENNIDEIRENIKYFMDSLLEEGFDIGEMNEDDLYHLYQFCIDETIDLNEGPLSFMKGIVKDPRVQQAALKYGQKYGGKLAAALKTGAKEVLKVPAQGVKNIGKALIKPLQTKVGSVAATLAGAEALLAGEKSKVRQLAGQTGPALTAVKKYVYGDDQQPAVAKPAPTPPKQEKQKQQVTSKLYEYAAGSTGSTPLTVSGGRTGTGVGKEFKARSWTQAEVEKYKKVRGASQIAKDKAAQAQARQQALKLAADERATPKDEFAGARRKSQPDQSVAMKPANIKSKPIAKPSSESPAVREYMKAAAAARKSGDAAQMAKVRDTGLDIWRKKYAGTLAKNVNPDGTQKGTGQSVMAKQADELRDLRPAATETGPQAQSALPGGAYSPVATARMTTRTKNILGVKEQYDAYDLVLEYLLSNGHVDTLDEAHYVMMQMDGEYIQNIVEVSGELFRGIFNPNNSAASKVQKTSPFNRPVTPLPSITSPFSKPASRDDSGKLTPYGAGGGTAAEKGGKSRDQIMRQGAKNLENKKPVNQGPDFGR